MFKKKIIILLSLFITCFALAQAPIENLDQSANADTQQNSDNQNQAAQTQPYVANTSLTPEQRITRVEQQMANFSQMNLPQRIDALQQQVQQLQGQMEVQTHQMQLMQKQLQQTQITNSPTNNTATAAPPANHASDDSSTAQNDETAYQFAFNLLVNKKYNRAVTALQQYVKAYPQGKYIANAHYWLGEIYYLQNNNDLAAKEFKTIVTQFPNDAKVPDSLLKLAFIEDAKGNHDLAKQQLKKIVKNYPGTTAAQLATIRLKNTPS